MFEDGLEERITEAVVLPPRETILFCGWWSFKGGSFLVMQEMLDSTWPAQLIGLEERLRWKWWWALSRKVIKPFQTPSWKRELRPVCQDTPKEQQRQTGPPQQHTTLKSGCKTLRKMLLKWRWEMAMCVIVGLSTVMLILNVWIEVEDKVPHDYWETLPVDLPLQGEGVLMKEAIRVPISQPWQGGLDKVTKQEEVWGWRSICQSSRMKRPEMLWLTVSDSGM